MAARKKPEPRPTVAERNELRQRVARLEQQRTELQETLDHAEREAETAKAAARGLGRSLDALDPEAKALHDCVQAIDTMLAPRLVSDAGAENPDQMSYNPRTSRWESTLREPAPLGAVQEDPVGRLLLGLANRYGVAIAYDPNPPEAKSEPLELVGVPPRVAQLLNDLARSGELGRLG